MLAKSYAKELKNTYFGPSKVVVVKVFEHFEHWKGLSLLCARLWCPRRSALDGKASWHKLQIKGLSPKWTVFLCCSNFHSAPKLLLQALHLWGRSWDSLMCLLRNSYNNKRTGFKSFQKEGQKSWGNRDSSIILYFISVTQLKIFTILKSYFTHLKNLDSLSFQKSLERYLPNKASQSKQKISENRTSYNSQYNSKISN